MRQVHYLTDEQCTTLLNYLPKYFSRRKTLYSVLRCRVTVLLMLDAGLRVGELVQLQWLHLWDENSAVKVLYLPGHVTKTKESRQVPLTDRLQLAIENFYLFDPHTSMERLNSFVFCGTNGRDTLTTRSIQLLLKKICRLCLYIDVTPHMFRHTFATCVMRKAPLSVLQNLLGHKRLSSTGIYLHPTIKDSVKAIKSLRR
ncbi:Tyrosine recombinase XerC [subsurface metagenome]